MLDFILNNQEQFMVLLRQHIVLTVLAIVLAIALGIPLAILASRVPFMEKPVLILGNLGQAIPSLVVLALCLPIMGIGFAPSLAALLFRAILPILLNTFVGIKNVDHGLIEAARGMGMTENQILWKVQIPITVPVMLAGIRTATVQAISLATLAAFAGGGSLGNLIQQGIMINHKGRLFTGAVSTAVLALLADFIIGWLEKWFTPRGLKVSA
ncbi:MAG TPA: ABC transporter permease [Bacillota bacterium]|jgi:osmoprotectant transport system permease protein|nr:ABC transporter permease [Bacillota bacterium]HOJ83095.1 ABC transporter permease [Bacillota bacterium]HOL15261.1 ABC transporter permease [Bacillota bacterium]HPZ11248.1 ABC transporter permease [Bacillota bacterium]HQE09322.1 ABC transporter permease [Bacillota bacterium]